MKPSHCTATEMIIFYLYLSLIHLKLYHTYIIYVHIDWFSHCCRCKSQMSIWNVWRNCCDFAIFNFHQTFDNIKILLTWNTILRLYSIFSIVIFDFISKLVEWLVWVPISTTVLHHTSTDYIGAKNRNLLMPLLHLSP